MQNTYDKLKDFAMILGDHDKDEAEKYRNLMRGVVIRKTNTRNRPIYERIPYVMRSMIYVDPDTTVSKQGSFSCALPAIAVKEGNTLLVKVLNSGGTPEPKLKGVKDWQLPEGGQAGVVSGQGGVLVAGTEIDENKKIFIPSGSLSLIANHRSLNATEGSSLVSDLTRDGKIGLQSLLSKAFWVSKTPRKVDADLRNVVALNSYSEGARSGKGVDHQGGAIVLFNSNIRSLVNGEQPPKVTAWSAWTDDGPYFEGEGAKDLHIKGVDADGTPHLPLMYHKERTKFGPGPQRRPSAPFDFLESFAVRPKFSTRIYRAEIKYDSALVHSNPNGVNKFVEGKWIVEYRLPHQMPTEDVQRKRPDDTDPNVKTSDPARFKDTQRKPVPTIPPEIDDPGGDPNSKIADTNIKGAEPDFPGAGDSGGGPGTCGHPGSTPIEPGPGDGGVVGGDVGSPDNEDSQAKQDSALNKKREANKGVETGHSQNVQHPEVQTNLVSVNVSKVPGPYLDRLQKPLWSHMQVAYPSFLPVLPKLEDGGLTQRGLLTTEEQKLVDDWNFGSTQLATYGNVDNNPEKVAVDNDRDTVLGGYVIAGSDLTPPQIYDPDVAALEATLLLRPESAIRFGVPQTNGAVTEWTDESSVVHPAGRVNVVDDNLEMQMYRESDATTEDQSLFKLFNTLLLDPMTTAQRPTPPLQGMFRFNSTLGSLEVYDGSNWQQVEHKGWQTVTVDYTDLNVVSNVGTFGLAALSDLEELSSGIIVVVDTLFAGVTEVTAEIGDGTTVNLFFDTVGISAGAGAFTGERTPTLFMNSYFTVGDTPLTLTVTGDSTLDTLTAGTLTVYYKKSEIT